MRCYKCKQEKSEACFYKDASRPNGYENLCKICSLAKKKAQSANKRYSRRDYINDLKKKPCHDCGVCFPPYVMDFDHREGVEKLFQISSNYSYNILLVLAEIEKCDLVCANCHRQRTHTRGSTL